MAELKSSETEVSEVKAIYEALRENDDYFGINFKQRLPPLSAPRTQSSPSTAAATTATTIEQHQQTATTLTASEVGGNKSSSSSNNGSISRSVDGRGHEGSSCGDTTPPSLQLKSAKDALNLLESLRRRMETLRTKIDKFRKRSKEKDPVTDKPRYGEKTLNRVHALLALYDDLDRCLYVAFHPGEQQLLLQETDNNNISDETSTEIAPTLIDAIRKQAEEEENEAQQKEREEKERREREERERQAEEARALELRRQQEDEERLREERERAERARRAEEMIRARDRAREEQERADRTWYDSVKKGPDGVREQLAILIESTSNDPNAQSTALGALHTMFTQIKTR